MDLSLINPYIRLATESRIPNGGNIAQRVIYDYEIIHLAEGSFTFFCEGKPYLCKEGDIIFIRPGVRHAFCFDRGEICQPHIHFDITHRPQSELIPISFKDYGKMSDEERAWIHKDYFYPYASTPLLAIQNKTEFLETFYRIVSGEEDDIAKKSLMIKLLSIIINDNFPLLLKSDKQPNTVKQIKDYIDAGNGMDATLDGFAKIFFYDKFHLERKFKETFGVSLIEYRNIKRMEIARDLLKFNSVSKVAEKMGYQSIFSFSRAYKSYFGYAPSKNKG